jgi:hypothetical protein
VWPPCDRRAGLRNFLKRCLRSRPWERHAAIRRALTGPAVLEIARVLITGIDFRGLEAGVSRGGALALAGHGEC